MNAPGIRPDIRLEATATIHDWMARGDVTLIDVREPQEWAQARIPGAVLLPLSSFDPAAVTVPPGKKLVFHCRSGVRCGAAAELLASAGRAPKDAPIHRLAGGILAWIAAGLPIEQDQLKGFSAGP